MRVDQFNNAPNSAPGLSNIINTVQTRFLADLTCLAIKTLMQLEEKLYAYLFYLKEFECFPKSVYTELSALLTNASFYVVLHYEHHYADAPDSAAIPVSFTG